MRATQLAKDVGFKLDFHLMPDLPGSTPELDMEMFKDVLFGEDLQVANSQPILLRCEKIIVLRFIPQNISQISGGGGKI